MEYDNTTRRDYDNTTAEHDDSGPVVVSVATAAQLLNITPGAVRKRLERGTLAGHKRRGTWSVVLDATDTTRHDSDQRDAQTRQHDSEDAPATTARQQLEAFQVAFVAPLVAQVAELSERAGRLENERDTLSARVAQLEAAQDESHAPAGVARPGAPGAFLWAFRSWAWLPVLGVMGAAGGVLWWLGYIGAWGAIIPAVAGSLFTLALMTAAKVGID